MYRRGKWLVALLGAVAVGLAATGPAQADHGGHFGFHDGGHFGFRHGDRFGIHHGGHFGYGYGSPVYGPAVYVAPPPVYPVYAAPPVAYGYGYHRVYHHYVHRVAHHHWCGCYCCR